MAVCDRRRVTTTLLLLLIATTTTTTTTNAFVVPTSHSIATATATATATTCPATSTTALASSLETSSQQRRSLDERMAALERGNGNHRGAAAYSNIETERMRHLDTSSTAELQGEGAIKTWSFDDPALETVDVRMYNEGLPLEAVLDLWQGPSHTPTQAIIYSEDGNQHPLTAKILLLQHRSHHGSHTVGIRNTAPMTFPCTATVGATSHADASILRLLHAPEEVVQGGALHTFTLDPYVDRVRVLIKNDVFGDGRPLHARIELLQGPNNKKQVLEVYTDDGPFYCEMETPGSGYVVRVVNISPMEFPLGAVVETYGEGGRRNTNYRNDSGGGYGNNNSYNNRGGAGGSYYDNDSRYASSDRSRYDVRNGRGGSYYGSAGASNSFGRNGGGSYYGNNNSNRRYGSGSTYGDNYYNGNNNRLGGYGNYGNSLYSGNRNQGYGYGYGNNYGYGNGSYSGNNRYNNGGYGYSYNNNRYNNGGYGYNNNNNRGGYGYNNNNNNNNRYGSGYGYSNNNSYGGYRNNNNGGNFGNRFMRNNNDVVRDGNLNRSWYN